MTIKAIAAQVHLGSSKSANANLHRQVRQRQPSATKMKNRLLASSLWGHSTVVR